MLEFMLHTNLSYYYRHMIEDDHGKNEVKTHPVTSAHILSIRTGLCGHP